jgi:hypothetical protein
VTAASISVCSREKEAIWNKVVFAHPLALALLLVVEVFACSESSVHRPAGQVLESGVVDVSGNVLPESCTGICNASTPSYPRVSEFGGAGDITMYSTGPSRGGACNYGETDILYYAAMNVNLQPGDKQGQWQDGRICGQCVEVTTLTATGAKSIVVRIMDKCADEYCGVDLGGLAPASVMSDGFGRYQGIWRFVSCDGHPEVSDGPPSLYVFRGSNPYWALVQVRNPPWLVAAIEWQQQDSPGLHGWFAYAGTTYSENSYQVPLQILQAQASFDLTVLYTDGSRAWITLTSSELADADRSYPLR